MTIIGLAGFLVFSWGILWAQQTGRSHFLTHGPGSLEESLGGAVCASVEGPNALYYNAAGLAQGDSGITAEFSRLLPGVNYSWMASALSVGSNHLGLGVISLDLGEITTRSSLFDSGATAKSYQRAYILGLSRQVGSNLSLGASAGLLDFSLSGYESRAHYLDLGAAWNALDSISLGAAIKNAYFSGLNFAGNKEVYPQELRAGAMMKKGPLSFMAEAQQTLDGTRPRFAVGLGISPIKILSLRLGMNGNPRFGVGINAGNNLFALDFSWQLRSIAPTARVGLSYFFRGEDEDQRRWVSDPLLELKARAKALRDYYSEESKRLIEEGGPLWARESLEKLLVLKPTDVDVRNTLNAISQDGRTYPTISLFPIALTRQERIRRRLWLRFAVAYAQGPFDECAHLAQDFTERWTHDQRSELIRILLPYSVRQRKKIPMEVHTSERRKQ